MNILSKKMSLIDFVFSKLRTPKTSLDKCLKSLISDYMSTGNIVNKPKHFSNLHGRTFIWLIDFVFPKLRTLKTWLDKCLESLVSENISKSNMGKEPRHCFKSPLLTCKILGLLVKTLAADEKYPVLNKENLTILIQMQLSQKEKPFSKYFAAFLTSRLNFERF